MEQKEKKKFLGVHFKCCNIYVRVYKNRTEITYIGHCPRCGKKVIFPIKSMEQRHDFLLQNKKLPYTLADNKILCLRKQL